MKQTLTFLCVLALLAWAGPAWALNIDFDGGTTGAGREFDVAENWVGDVKPVDGDSTYIAYNYICEIDTTEHVDRIRLGVLSLGGGSGAGTLDIMPGCNLTADTYLSCGADRTGVGTGTVNQSGGTVMWDDMTIGRFYNGTYNLTGGVMNREYTTGSIMFMLGSDSTARSEFNQTGGTARIGNLFVAADTSIKGGDAEMTISGGLLDIGGNVTVGAHSTSDAGTTGTMHVIGADATITIAGNYIQQRNLGDGILHCEISGNPGISVIAVTGTAAFDGTLTVDATGTGHTGTYTLMTYASAGGDFDDDNLPDGWTYDIGSTALTVTVPEPATLVLLGLGGLGVLLRRRRA